jgi:hypothetical protein
MQDPSTSAAVAARTDPDSVAGEAAEVSAQALLELINAAWTTQVIHATCALGLPDHMAAGTTDVAALSAAAACDADALARLLRAMAAIGLCEIGTDAAVNADSPTHWRLTAMGHRLCTDDPWSLRHWALHAGGPMWQRQGELADAVRTGQSWSKRHGTEHSYAHLLTDTAAAEVFHGAMVELTRHAVPRVVPLLEVGDARVVVDVGGGRGELLAAVLERHPLAVGVLFDQPTALVGARAVFDRAGIAERCSLEGGDFFEAIPEGGDVYLMKSVLHNWDDRHCTVLLRACAATMPHGARLLIIERVMPDKPGSGAAHRACARSDLNMLVSLTGRERCAAAYERMLVGAGLTPTATRESSADWTVIEARHARA